MTVVYLLNIQHRGPFTLSSGKRSCRYIDWVCSMHVLLIDQWALVTFIFLSGCSSFDLYQIDRRAGLLTNLEVLSMWISKKKKKRIFEILIIKRNSLVTWIHNDLTEFSTEVDSQTAHHDPFLLTLWIRISSLDLVQGSWPSFIPTDLPQKLVSKPPS